jgi:hypothetical protein
MNTEIKHVMDNEGRNALPVKKAVKKTAKKAPAKKAPPKKATSKTAKK